MRKIIFALFFVFTIPAGATTDSLAVYPKGWFRFNYENDFFNATDYYFTQGVRFELAAPFVNKSPLTKILLSAGKSSFNRNGILFGQECFTPTSIREDNVIIGDRPFAAAIYLGEFRISDNAVKKFRISSEIRFGFLGPRAGGMQTQVTIHRWLNNVTPHGWQHQVSNDVVLNYAAKFEKQLATKKYFAWNVNGDAWAGTLYDKAGAGTKILFGIIGENSASKKFQCYGYAWGKADLIGYNATLQGGLFSKSEYTISAADMDRFVFGGGGGIVLRYKKLQVEYSKTWITPEFKNGLAHGWGLAGVTVYF